MTRTQPCERVKYEQNEQTSRIFSYFNCLFNGKSSRYKLIWRCISSNEMNNDNLPNSLHVSRVRPRPPWKLIISGIERTFCELCHFELEALWKSTQRSALVNWGGHSNERLMTILWKIILQSLFSIRSVVADAEKVRLSCLIIQTFYYLISRCIKC